MNGFDLYVDELEKEFEAHSNPIIADGQKAYMRHQFEFYGLKSDVRRNIQTPFLKQQFLPEQKDLAELVPILWAKDQREFQLFAQELVFKFSKSFDKNIINVLEYMVIHKSWWDTVDYISTKLMGNYFKQYPEQIETYVNKWLKSNHIWLQRSALLFQLKYNTDLDTDILNYCITQLSGSKEFFINKAIGWILREYSRTNPEWVKSIVALHQLAPLSKREALRLIN